MSDSNLALDERALPCQTICMTDRGWNAERKKAGVNLARRGQGESAMPCRDAIHLERIDPSRNMARYYALSIEMTLFSDWSCTRRFGRIGNRGGRVMLGLYETREAAEAAFFALLRSKTAKGYQPRQGEAGS